MTINVGQHQPEPQKFFHETQLQAYLSVTSSVFFALQLMCVRYCCYSRDERTTKYPTHVRLAYYCGNYYIVIISSVICVFKSLKIYNLRLCKSVFHVVSFFQCFDFQDIYVLVSPFTILIIQCLSVR